MGNDPAFLFYPGDYLRDTQCLCEGSQVAYDRIMCEHMRNICISQKQLNFFTKRLNESEKEELMLMLTEINGCFQIAWVAESITKRRAYSDSRRKNRRGNKKKDMSIISKTYDSHMENENENENESKKENGVEKKDPRPIKKIMEWLEAMIGGLLDGSIYDNEANCLDCLEKIEKDFPNERAADLLFWWIESALKDDFHKKNMTNFKYIFKNLGKLRLCHEAMEANNE